MSSLAYIILLGYFRGGGGGQFHAVLFEASTPIYAPKLRKVSRQL